MDPRLRKSSRINSAKAWAKIVENCEVVSTNGEIVEIIRRQEVLRQVVSKQILPKLEVDISETVQPSHSLFISVVSPLKC